MRYFGTMKNNRGILEIGGVSTKKLVKDFKSPLYIYDVQHIEDNIEKYKKGFKSLKFDTEIVYASKAFLARGMCQILNKHNMSIDAVSGGELYTIIQSGFPSNKIHMHGNNKTITELNMCFDLNVGSIIADNLDEIKKISKICDEKNKKMKIALRINTGIEAHTHEYIKTSKHSSKFGESIFDDSAENAVKEILKNEKMEFIGFHCHIGSQIFDTNAFLEEIKVMVKYTKEISEKFNINIPEINLGGGFGVYYTEEDVEVDIEAFTREMIICLENTLEEEKFKINKVSIEPGRSIVANAGSTLYTIGGIKTTYSGDKYLFIDGGMSDNMRPALYQAKYEAAIANKMNDELLEEVTIAGKCCESGDLIVKKEKVAKSEVGDIVITTTTGAYGYSMSNNYNKIERPAVVFVKDGKAQIAIKRETYEELTKNELEIEI